jgi:hypothetical protein
MQLKDLIHALLTVLFHNKDSKYVFTTHRFDRVYNDVIEMWRAPDSPTGYIHEIVYGIEPYLGIRQKIHCIDGNFRYSLNYNAFMQMSVEEALDILRCNPIILDLDSSQYSQTDVYLTPTNMVDIHALGGYVDAADDLEYIFAPHLQMSGNVPDNHPNQENNTEEGGYCDCW